MDGLQKITSSNIQSSANFAARESARKHNAVLTVRHFFPLVISTRYSYLCAVIMPMLMCLSSVQVQAGKTVEKNSLEDNEQQA